MADGDLTPTEAGELGRVVEVYMKAIEATEFECRLQALEEQQPHDTRIEPDEQID